MSTNYVDRLDVVVNADSGLYHRFFNMDAAGVTSAGGAQQQLDSGASASRSTGIALAGHSDYRMHVFYGRGTHNGVRRRTLENGVWSATEVVWFGSDLTRIISAYSSEYDDQQGTPRRRNEVWFVADQSSGSADRVWHWTERWDWDGTYLGDIDYETTVPAYPGCVVSSTGFLGNSDAFYRDYARVVSPDRYVDYRDGSSSTNFNYTLDSALFVSDARVEVTPWSRF